MRSGKRQRGNRGRPTGEGKKDEQRAGVAEKKRRQLGVRSCLWYGEERKNKKGCGGRKT
jgi:hypothetical protein